MYKNYQFDSNKKVKIKDLCQEDKKGIGKLMLQLAQLKEEKEILLRKLDEIQKSESKQKKLQTEIDQLDEEIIELQNQEAIQKNYQSQSLPSKPQCIYQFENDDDDNQHQSPNFKILKEIKDEQSDSSIYPIINFPQMVDQEIQTSIIQKNITQNGEQKKSKKKEVLIKKIQEFEKIVNRLNFSNDQTIELTSTNRKSGDDQSSINNGSYLQNVFQKLLALEQQSQIQVNRHPIQEVTVKSEQQSEIQPQIYDEDDLVIQLLNSDTSSYKPLKEINISKCTNNNHNTKKSENIFNTQKQQKTESFTSPIAQEAYCKNIMNKYNNLLQELNK